MSSSLRILHVVGGVGPGNPYGGPVAVASDQVAELRSRGHSVDLVAPGLVTPGLGRTQSVEVTAPEARSFQSFRLVPGAGFSGIVSPAMSGWIARRIRCYDVVHVHLARDLTTTPAALTALAARVPLVVQTHGMVDASSRSSAAVIDAIALRRILRRAAAVLCLTTSESDDVAEVGAAESGNRVILPNGVTCPDRPPDPWVGEAPAVLFAARLARRKRPDLFVAASEALIARGLEASFVIAGADEGLGRMVDEAVARVARPNRLRSLGPLERHEVAKVLAWSSVLVLPSADEPFPMAVLEALAAGRAVIVTESCGLASFVEKHCCGRVVAPCDVDMLAEAIESLVSDRNGAAEMGRRGWAAVRQYLSISSVVDQLESCYVRAVAGATDRSAVRRRRTRS